MEESEKKVYLLKLKSELKEAEDMVEYALKTNKHKKKLPFLHLEISSLKREIEKLNNESLT